MRKKTNKLIKTTARSLRRHQTDAEELLWKVIRNRKLANRKFLRQHPIEFEWNGQKRFFIADFFCHEAMLVIELDGKIHDLQKDRDAMREYVIKCLGMNVLRFTNDEIFNDIEKVILCIKNHL